MSCGHCKRAGHCRPTCPEFRPGVDPVAPVRVREALTRAGRADALFPTAVRDARTVSTDSTSWGLW